MRTLMLILIALLPCMVLGQTKSISLKEKVKAPYITIKGDTVKVDSKIRLLLGSNPDGSFKYVQVLNNFNEPVQAAASRFSMKAQEVKFFKFEDETAYAFTKFFVINIEAALMSKEAELIK